jgi:hypothetical protein
MPTLDEIEMKSDTPGNNEPQRHRGHGEMRVISFPVSGWECGLEGSAFNKIRDRASSTAFLVRV